MKKITRILSVVLLLAMLFSLCACAEENTEVPQGFLQAENEGADYYFYYPSDWILDRHDAGMTSAYVSERDFSNVSVTAFTNAGISYPSLVEYAEEYYLAQFESNFNQLSVERNQDQSLKRENLTVDGKEAIAIKYSADFGGEGYTFRAWLISHNGYIYTVLYTAKDGLYESHLEEASAIATNLRFR